MVEINLEERFKKFKNILNMWEQRDLSLKGKITILKSLAMTQLIYVTNVLYVPNTFIERIQKEIQHFVWNDKPHEPPKIKTSTMIADISRGGIKMSHFETQIQSQQIMWI